MKKDTLYLIAACIVLLIYGCNDPLERMELGQKKIVTRCFIAPQDTLIKVYVGSSKTFTLNMADFSSLGSDDTVNQIRNAKVTLSDQNHSVQLAYKEFNLDFGARRLNDLPPDGAYYYIRASEFPIQAGGTYTLTVEIPDGTVAQATCTVPLQAPSFEMEYSLRQRRDTVINDVIAVCDYTLTWNDFPGRGDYYYVTSRVCDSIQYYTDTGGPFLFTSYSGYGATDVTLDNTLFNDNISDGESYTYKSGSGVDHWIFHDHGKLLKSRATLNTFVLRIDENYYRYHRSIFDQIKAKGNALLEPILIYTNFKGGVGVFAGYNRAQKVVPLNY